MAHLPTPINLTGWYHRTSAAGRRSQIRHSSLQLKYDRTLTDNEKDESRKLINITKTYCSPTKYLQVTEFIKDSIAMGLDDQTSNYTAQS